MYSSSGWSSLYLSITELPLKRISIIRFLCFGFKSCTKEMLKNQENARTYCRFTVEAGCVPIAPHIYFTQFMNDNDRRERDLALFMDIVLLSKCAEL